MIIYTSSTSVLSIRLIVLKQTYFKIPLEKLEDTIGLIRSRKPKNRQNNGQKKLNKKTKNDLQMNTQKTKVTDKLHHIML